MLNTQGEPRDGSRLEQTIAWSQLTGRIKRFRYAPGNEFLHQPGIMLGTLELRLEFDPATEGSP